ncbi:AzlD domain-containing protein [Salinisphaera sp.]|uniref:AzlD domain-containing protein n=1 Tax=Salinisphaera sp. TaxID=1914330 RepID=UPI000C62FD09|nr:AzlD domain-containing protein [Salinisphaera sp.]MBS63097.1 branched-chain amino acid ABC transporter permease [Salinisphaera sp.]
MADTGVWIVVLAVGALTFALRWSFIALADSLAMPAGVQRALRFVPAAVLAAILLPAIVVDDGRVALSPDNLRLFAGVAAAVVAWRTRNMLYTIATGMLVLWGLQALRAML